MAVGMLWVLDASINISMEPSRALVNDRLPSEQRTTGFGAQTFFIGVGAVVASSLPWVLTNWFPRGQYGRGGANSGVGALLVHSGRRGVFLAVLWTVLAPAEIYPPADLAEFEAEKARTAGVAHGFRSRLPAFSRCPKPCANWPWCSFSWFALFTMWIYTTQAVTSHIFHTTDTTSVVYNKAATGWACAFRCTTACRP
ncbi:MAG: hypothetical protein WKG07_12145 [Hymenobacter sp.]